jgi:diacylglycerol kinase family enzyme
MMLAGRVARVDVVLNPRARALLDAAGLRRRLGVLAAESGARVHETPDLAALQKVADLLSLSGSERIVLVGGDGSFMAGLSALARAFAPGPLPPIGLAPAGTVCTVARNLGLRGTSSARGVLRAACGGTLRTRLQPTLRVTDESAGQRIGFIFGGGLVTNFFRLYDALPKRGVAAAARVTARIFAGSFVGSPLARSVLEPSPHVLTVDGEVQPSKTWSLLVASVFRDLGLHFRVTYRAGEQTSLFHVVASGLPAAALGRQMPRALAGLPLHGDPRVDTLARSLRVDFGTGDGAYVLDGDLLRARWVAVEPGPVLCVIEP